MKTARQYAEEALKALPIGENESNLSKLLKTIPLEALVKCAEASRKYLKANVDRDEVAAMYAQRELKEALNELEREEKK